MTSSGHRFQLLQGALVSVACEGHPFQRSIYQIRRKCIKVLKDAWAETKYKTF